MLNNPTKAYVDHFFFIFSACGGEMLYKRSVVEEQMLTFCSKDFYSLSKEKRDKVFEYLA